MSRLEVILILLGLSVGGLVRLVIRCRSLVKKREFLIEYYNKFEKFVEDYPNKEIDGEVYAWLTRNVTRIQRELGIHGVMEMYKKACSSCYLSNYAIIINTLPDIIRRTAHKNDILSCFECMTRYLGVLEERTNLLVSQILNPLVWLREGVKLILLLPLIVLVWFGMIGLSSAETIERSPLVTTISGMVSFLGLVGALITIILGWKEALLAFNLVQE